MAQQWETGLEFHGLCVILVALLPLSLLVGLVLFDPFKGRCEKIL